MMSNPLRSAFVLGSFTAALALSACATTVTQGGGGPSQGAGGDGGSAGSGESNGGSGGADPSTCTSVESSTCHEGDSQSCGTCIQEGTSSICGTQLCELVRNADGSCVTQWGDCIPPNTPLVLSFDGARVEWTADRAHAFDVTGVESVVTDWPTARTPWLALDRDGSGAIENGGELFGSATRLADGRLAKNGFEALAALDDNGDGRITPEDASFARIVVWSDADRDRRSSSGELRSLSDLGVRSIDLAYRIEARCDSRGNCEAERAAFTYVDASGATRTGSVIDVHLALQH